MLGKLGVKFIFFFSTLFGGAGVGKPQAQRESKTGTRLETMTFPNSGNGLSPRLMRVFFLLRVVKTL